MIYLASPYSHPDPLTRKTRFLLAEQCVASLLRATIWAYSPIVHCHELAERYSLPTDFTFWKEYNFDMIRRADAVFVLDIPGVSESKGVRAETEIAEALHLPIFYVNEDGVKHSGPRY